MIKIMIMCENTEVLDRVLKNINNKEIHLDYFPNKLSESYIVEFLHRLGISPKYRGYHYLKDAIIAYSVSPVSIKDIYLNLAMKYGVSCSCIERGMCRAIELGFLNNDIDEVSKIFGSCLCCKRGNPTNLEVITTIVERLESMI